MPPDYLLRCTTCGSEAVWDTEACPPVGVPEIGHPVLWQCEACGNERRHVISCQAVIIDKLHHEICVATEVDRSTVDRVMSEMRRYRRRTGAGSTEAGLSAAEADDVADVTGVPRDVVGQISNAEAAWIVRRGYVAGGAYEA
jgi:hypothetical protein